MSNPDDEDDVCYETEHATRWRSITEMFNGLLVAVCIIVVAILLYKCDGQYVHNYDQKPEQSTNR